MIALPKIVLFRGVGCRLDNHARSLVRDPPPPGARHGLRLRRWIASASRWGQESDSPASPWHGMTMRGPDESLSREQTIHVREGQRDRNTVDRRAGEFP